MGLVGARAGPRARGRLGRHGEALELTDQGRPGDEPADPPGEAGAVVASVGGLRRGVYLVLAGLFFALGALGAVLPGLPTTPFLLLTSFFLVRSSPRLNATLLRSRVFGPVLRDWQERGGVRRGVKLQAIGLILVFAGGAAVFSEWSGPARWTVFGLALVGVTVVSRLPEITPDLD